MTLDDFTCTEGLFRFPGPLTSLGVYEWTRVSMISTHRYMPFVLCLELNSSLPAQELGTLLELQPNTCYCFPTCCKISAILKTENSPASSLEWRDCVCTHTSTRFWLSNNSSQTFVDFKRSVNIWSAFGKTFTMLQWFWCFNILCPGEEHDKHTDCELFAWHLSCSTYFNIWGHKIGRKIYHIYVDKNAI